MDGFWQAVKVVVVTALVVTAAGFTARQTATRMRSAGRGRYLAVVDSISLGMQRGLFLVRLGERHVVIGLARDQITLLSDLGTDGLGSLPALPSAANPGPAGCPGSRQPRPDDPGARRLAGRLDALWAKLTGDEQSQRGPGGR
ncbi:MAG: flagellar biosynthetic protein FliO [Bacillota bacterium]|nr:flagellar biosynthetic protein FliO [Bacillota bacterium]